MVVEAGHVSVIIKERWLAIFKIWWPTRISLNIDYEALPWSLAVILDKRKDFS